MTYSRQQWFSWTFGDVARATWGELGILAGVTSFGAEISIGKLQIAKALNSFIHHEYPYIVALRVNGEQKEPRLVWVVA